MTDTKPMTGQDSVPLPSAENLREREEYTAYLASTPRKDLGSSGAVASSGPDSQCPTAVAWRPTKEAPHFDEQALGYEISRVWGAFGGHAEIYGMLLRDAARYHCLRGRLLALDSNYGERRDNVLVFLWPESARVSMNLDASIDALLNGGTGSEREARAAGGVGDERDGRKEAAPRAEQAEGWRPMDELPHEMGAVLVRNSIGCMAIVNMISATGMGYWMDDDGAHERISDMTGWMPPPAAAPALKPRGGGQ